MTDLDPMDARLREYADRWRESEAPPSRPRLDRLTPRRPSRRTWWLAAASAAAVGAVIVGGTQLVGDNAGRQPSGTPSATPSGPPSIEPTPRSRLDALRHQLADNAFVRLELLGIGPGGLTAPRGPVLCSLRVMGSSDGGSTLYIWLGCGDYFITANGTAAEGTGGDDPAVVEVSGRGAAVKVQSITFPRQEYRDADIKRLFPPSIASHIYDEVNTHTSPSPAQLKEEAATRAGLPGAFSTSTGTTSPRPYAVEDCSWLTSGTALLTTIRSTYGDPHDCFALAGVWVMTTDRRSGAGSVGLHICDNSCAEDIPTKLADWTFSQPSTAPGAYERVAGTTPDGSILFVGTAGEFTLDPATGTFRRSAQQTR